MTEIYRQQEQQRAAKAQEKGGQAAKGTAAAKDKEGSSKPAAGKGKDAGKAASSVPANASTTSQSSHGGAATSGGKAAAKGATQNIQGPDDASTSSPLSLFLHLDPPRSARSLNSKIQREQIHPSILRLALQYADFRIVGANARCIAMLEAFKDVCLAYSKL